MGVGPLSPARPAGRGAIRLGIQDAPPVDLEIIDVLGDDGTALDASRQVRPEEANWRERGRERVSAHGISFVRKKENPYLLRASLLKGDRAWMARVRAGGPYPARAVFPVSRAGKCGRRLRIDGEAEHRLRPPGALRVAGFLQLPLWDVV